MLDAWFMPKLGTLLVLQLAVVTVALLKERPSAILAGVLGALVFNYFFTEPRYSFHMTELDDIVNLMIFLVIALITSQLAVYYRSQQEALKKAQLRSSILLSVSHDLRTPLSSIIGTLSTMQEYGHRLTPAEQQELLTAALDESHRLHRYVENLLQATKLQHGELRLNLSEQSIMQVINAVTERFASPRIQVQFDRPLPQVKVREYLLAQALYNLIDNALKYSPQGSPVLIRVSADSQWLSIQVSDQGPGIPLRTRDKVFELFYSTRQGDAGEGGTGLGLAVAKGIVEAHGGRLEILPVDTGSTFAVRLPVCRGEQR